MYVFVLMISLLMATTAHAEIFKCVVGGKTTFSQQPCAADAVVVTPKGFATTHEGQVLHDNPSADDKDLLEVGAIDFRLMELERRIKEAESQIIYLAHKRDRAVSTHEKTDLSSRIDVLKDTRVQLKAEHSAMEAEQREIATKLYLRGKM